MTKNTKTGVSQKDLTEILKWRLNKAPTLEDVTTMLDKQVISKEEARQLLFNIEVPDDSPSSEKEKALKEQIKFLEGVVEKLSQRGTVNVWPGYTFTATYPVKYWVTSGTLSSGGTIYALNSSSNTVSLSSSITGSSGGVINA